MHGHELYARGFRAARHIGRIERAIVPAEPHFECDRYFDRADNGLDQAQRVVGLAHQRATREAAGHFACGAAHVDVDDAGAGGFRHACALGHPIGLATDELYDVRLDPLALRLADDVRPGGDQFPACHHLRDDEAGAEALG